MPVVKVEVAKFTGVFNPLENGVLGGLKIAQDQIERAIRIKNFERKPVPPGNTSIRKHIGRIAFFATRGWKDPIKVHIEELYMRDITPAVTDGNHRLAAAIFAGQDTIECELTGKAGIVFGSQKGK